MTELKPCPFCGEMPEWHQDLYDNTYCLYCNNEKCNTDMVATDHYENKEDAIKAWNTRTSPWHTVTPTEEGWYLCWVSYKKEIAPMVYKWKNGKFMLTDTWESDDNILMWQKIDPYKEKEDAKSNYDF